MEEEWRKCARLAVCVHTHTHTGRPWTGRRKMDDALKNQEHHPQTELQGWAKKSGSTLVVMLVPSGTPGTGRTNARREKRSDVVTDRTGVLETAEIQRQSQNPPRDTTVPPPPLSVGKLKQSSDTMTDRWESRNTLMYFDWGGGNVYNGIFIVQRSSLVYSIQPRWRLILLTFDISIW